MSHLLSSPSRLIAVFLGSALLLSAPLLAQAEAPDLQAYDGIMRNLMGLFALLLGIAALVLDNAAFYTVAHMGDIIGGVNGLSAVGVTWRVLRDFGNILIIFGFLAVGITTILNVDIYGSASKMLPKLLIAAVFLNFSLFISMAVVDVGNLFATQFYTQINGGTPPKPVDLFSLESIEKEGISNKIMSQLGLQTIYGSALSPNTQVFKAGNMWFVGFMGIILFMIAAFVFFSLAFILIIRFIALIFLIIVSPIGFAGFAIPQLADLASKWWRNLFAQVITAPVLLLMLYVALAVITDARFLTSFGVPENRTEAQTIDAWVGYVNGTAGISALAGMLLSFIVAMGLLLGVVVLSKKLSAVGAGWAMKAGGALSFGAVAWGTRNSLGWGSHILAGKLRGTQFARIPLLGTRSVRILEGASKRSLDMRALPGVKSLGIDAGTTQKGGYTGSVERGVKARTEYASKLKGRELDEVEKVNQKELQKAVKADQVGLEKVLADMRKMTPEMLATTDLQSRADAYRKKIKENGQELEDLESVTDRGAQRKYASNLLAGLGQKSFFNKYINLEANTEAAKKIIGEAKKSKDERDMDKLKKLVEKAAKEDEGGAATPPAAAAGAAGAASPAAAAGGGH